MQNRSIRLLESDDETVTLDREQRRRILERFGRFEKELEDLREENRRLRDENRRLDRELKKLKSTPQMLSSSDKTAEAGGVPSSRTFYRRPRHTDRRRGGQLGHAGVSRKKPETNAPPVVLSLEKCTNCGSCLGEPCDSYSRTVTDLPVMQPLIYDIIVNRYRCHTCGSRVSTEAPLPPHTAFGPSLASFVATMRMQATSFDKIAMLLKQFFSIRIGVATLQRIERWVADKLMPQYSRLKTSLKRHKHWCAVNGEQSVSESLTMLRTGKHVARERVAEKSVHSKQTDKGDISTHEAVRPRRESAGSNVSEAICSVVIVSHSNVVNEGAEPVSVRRRQHGTSTPAEMYWPSGVASWTCGEGCSQENGRAGIAPMRRTERRKHIKRPVAGWSKPFRNCEVRMPISNSEMASEGMQAVRQVHSSNEFPVMGRAAKGPDFRRASDCVSWQPKSRSVVHG